MFHVKRSPSIPLNFGNGRNVSRETFRPNLLYRYTGNKRVMSGLKIDGSVAYNILNLPFATCFAYFHMLHFQR
jgi:hypothetical protein